MPLNRTFSFEDHDEQALSSDQQERDSYHASYPYRDSPSRDLHVTPPPSYRSPPPHDPVSPPSPTARFHPGAHPDSSYARLSDQRFSSIDDSHRRNLPLPTDSSSADEPPPPPAHRRIPSSQLADDGRLWGDELGYSRSMRTAGSTTTPGMDNLGRAAAGGGIAGIAMGGANTNERQSGVGAMHAAEGARGDPYRGPAERDLDASDTPYVPSRPEPSRQLRTQDSYGSVDPFRTPAPSPGQTTPRVYPSNYSGHSIPLSEYPSAGESAPYQDSPYQSRSAYANRIGNDGPFNPNEIADDGDDGFMPDPKRRSVLAMGRQPSRDVLPATAAGAAGGAVGGSVVGKLFGSFGRKSKGPSANGSYNPVGQSTAYDGGADGGEGARRGQEKSEWLSRQTKGNNKMRWVVGLSIGVVVVLAIIGGIVGGVVASKNSSKNSKGGNSSAASNSTNNAATDLAANGDLDINSAEIKALMNNDNLHKVFPGMDYTPWGTQYPACLTYPPSQNNVTRDMAVLSQLTNNVRLYGTDCNQTEMVQHAISQLKLTDMKIWLGVWIETNTTTNDRQLSQMYNILEKTQDHSIFRGVIVGNEALYRAGLDKASSETDLINTLTEVKSNFSSKSYNLPVATSDLGDNWNAQLVAAVDIVMSNIHPFFAGVTPDVAPGWTWNFWQQHDTILTTGTSKQNVIAETGWPSAGGNDCGVTGETCSNPTAGSVAGVDEMNTYLDGFVCQSLANGTEFFW